MMNWRVRIVLVATLFLSVQVNIQPSQATMVENATAESDWPLSPQAEGITFCVVYLIESVNIVVGNIIAIAVFTSNRRLRKRKFYLLVNLAVADFLVGAVVVPWWTYDLALYFDLWVWRGNWTESAVAVAESVDLVTKYASLISLMVVSLERMYATLCPLKHRLVEEKTYYFMIGLVWTMSLFMPSVRVLDIYDLTSEDTFLFTTLSFTSFILLIIFASYIVIWVKIRFGEKLQHSKAAVKNRKLTASLLIVTVISLVTWLPVPVTYATYRLLLMNGSTAWSAESYSLVYYSAMILVFANSLVNPIIYSFRLPHFKKAATRLVCRYSDAHDDHSRLPTGRFSSRGTTSV